VLLALLAACASDPAADSTSAQLPTSAIDDIANATDSVAPDDNATSGDGDVTDADAVSERSVPSSAKVPTQDCRPLADLEDADELARWRVVNDGVMGGRSSADADVVDSVLILAGDIVTDGGGFSSVRLVLDEPLGVVTGLLLRVRTDGRSYELTVADAAPGRDPRISHQGPIPAIGDGEWEEVASTSTISTPRSSVNRWTSIRSSRRRRWRLGSSWPTNATDHSASNSTGYRPAREPVPPRRSVVAAQAVVPRTTPPRSPPAPGRHLIEHTELSGQTAGVDDSRPDAVAVMRRR